MAFGSIALAFKLALVAVFLLLDLTLHRFVRGSYDGRTNHFVRLSVFAGLTALILLIGFWGEVEFIYFQF
jgi:hypothetical protein